MPEAFNLLARNPSLGEPLVEGTDSSPIDLPPVTDSYILARLDLDVGPISDWLIYNRTLYYATRSAVFEMPLRINGTFDGADDPQRVIDAPALQLRARWGVIVGACGDAGLHPRRTYSWQQREVERLPTVTGSVVEYTSRIDWMNNFSLLRIGSDNEASCIVSSGGVAPGPNFEWERLAIHTFGTWEADRDDFMDLPERFQSGFASLSSAYFWKNNHVFRIGGSSEHKSVTGEFDLEAHSI